MHQLALPFVPSRRKYSSYRTRLAESLSDNLDFQNTNGEHSSHKLHSFPAKFPPQLPHKFISELTEKDDVVLDPMMGSGTTILEAFLLNRIAWGFDIDPLAILLSKVKTRTYDKRTLRNISEEVVTKAKANLNQNPTLLEKQILNRFDKKTLEFLNYWFAPETQLELMALIYEVESVKDTTLRDFLMLVMSSTIITKTGGVSLAYDLAHTRPHKAKVVVSKTGRIVVGNDQDFDAPRVKLLTKKLRSPIEEFEKRLLQNIQGVLESVDVLNFPPQFCYGNAQAMPIPERSVDLIVTSPPYASNAIDYMRAHKFSLVWLGYPISDLGLVRQKYIGGESLMGIELVALPGKVKAVINKVAEESPSKGRALHRYYLEMNLVLKEMFRVLKPGKASIVVVGNSTLVDQDVMVVDSLAEIGCQHGFQVPMVGVRQLNRDKRMLPASLKVGQFSQIQQRMHEEFVIGFYKPE